MTKVVIIGGGPGGYVAAVRAAQLGAEVMLIEKDRLGGTCLNAGCIPTKAMLRSAHLLDDVRSGKKLGVIAEVRLDFTAVQKNKAAVVRRLVNGVVSLMKNNNIEVVKGAASFKDRNTLVVETEEGKREVTFDRAILATGSIPFIPPIPGIDSPACIDSTGALELDKVPESMVIIGGGVIGVEFSTAFLAFGTKVTIVEMMPEILPMMDGELTKSIRRKLEKKGVIIHTGTRVVSIEDHEGSAVVHVEVDGEKKSFEGEKVLVSVGRRTNTENLGLDRAGIDHDRGKVIVDDHMRTNIPEIYAVGDCLGRTMLAHVASMQGECAAENLMGHETVYDERTNPSCLYTEPEFATVGLTEEKAREKNIPYLVGTFPLSANGKALIMNGGEGMVKILADPKYKEVLGVHILGPRATDLIAEGALAIRLEATVDELISTIHGHPTLGEAVREAAMDVLGRSIHKE